MQHEAATRSAIDVYKRQLLYLDISGFFSTVVMQRFSLPSTNRFRKQMCIRDRANTIRLNELERKDGKLLDDVVSTYDRTTYRYSIESIGTEADTARCV